MISCIDGRLAARDSKRATTVEIWQDIYRTVRNLLLAYLDKRPNPEASG